MGRKGRQAQGRRRVRVGLSKRTRARLLRSASRIIHTHCLFALGHHRTVGCSIFLLAFDSVHFES